MNTTTQRQTDRPPSLAVATARRAAGAIAAAGAAVTWWGWNHDVLVAGVASAVTVAALVTLAVLA